MTEKRDATFSTSVHTLDSPVRDPFTLSLHPSH